MSKTWQHRKQTVPDHDGSTCLCCRHKYLQRGHYLSQTADKTTSDEQTWTEKQGEKTNTFEREKKEAWYSIYSFSLFRLIYQKLF